MRQKIIYLFVTDKNNKKESNLYKNLNLILYAFNWWQQ